MLIGKWTIQPFMKTRVCTRCCVCVRPPGQLQKFTLNHEMDLDWKWQTLSTPSVAQTLVSDTRLALKLNELPIPILDHAY